MLTLRKANSIIKPIVGEKLAYAIKSPGLDLYDFGFGIEFEEIDIETNERRLIPPYILHATCPFIIKQPNGNCEFYDFEISPEIFEPKQRMLCGKIIQQAEINRLHHLIIRFDQITLEFIPYNNDIESWRFFRPGDYEHHLVVSGKTLETQ